MASLEGRRGGGLTESGRAETTMLIYRNHDFRFLITHSWVSRKVIWGSLLIEAPMKGYGHPSVCYWAAAAAAGIQA